MLKSCHFIYYADISPDGMLQQQHVAGFFLFVLFGVFLLLH